MLRLFTRINNSSGKAWSREAASEFRVSPEANLPVLLVLVSDCHTGQEMKLKKICVCQPGMQSRQMRSRSTYALKYHWKNMFNLAYIIFV